MAVITLLTDFGLNDEFVGVLKGVILAINPQARIVDITHGIAPQDLVSAAYRAQAAYRYFPKGTVHVVVVDPGVGSSRAIVAVQQEGHVFLAPDNGVLTLVVDAHKVDGIVRVTNDQFFLKPVSSTFHGRDILAPVAAHLSLGAGMDRLGPGIAAENLKRLPLEQPSFNADGTLTGTVVLIDGFGNLVTNIDSATVGTITALTQKREIVIRIWQHRILGLSQSYADVPPGIPLAIMGSKGYLEIAVNGERAASCLEAQRGDAVIVGKGTGQAAL
jgi:S-adenosylmethionine hydrolase